MPPFWIAMHELSFDYFMQSVDRMLSINSSRCAEYLMGTAYSECHSTRPGPTHQGSVSRLPWPPFVGDVIQLCCVSLMVGMPVHSFSSKCNCAITWCVRVCLRVIYLLGVGTL